MWASLLGLLSELRAGKLVASTVIVWERVATPGEAGHRAGDRGINPGTTAAWSQRPFRHSRPPIVQPLVRERLSRRQEGIFPRGVFPLSH